MKKIIFGILICLFFTAAKAQQCLDLNIVALMENIHVPSESAAKNFTDCVVEKNEHNQTLIKNYGADISNVDSLVSRTERDFNNASLANMGNANANMPSQQKIDDAKALAEKLQKMTPEQQKQWAMQQAAHPNYNATTAVHEDPSVAKLVFQTTDIAQRQLKLLDDEFAAKMRQIILDKPTAISAVKQPNTSDCPSVDKEGTPSCTCVNEREGKYWQEIVKIQDSYNAQLINLLQSYLPRIKALVSEVDDNIAQLKYGDAVKSTTFKQNLVNAQMSAFGNAFIETEICIEEIRKSGSDVYLNKLNCDHLVYDLSCGN